MSIYDYTCCFCQYILTDPITLGCKHSYCLDCLESYLGYLKLDKKYLKGEETNLLDIKCPTCRGKHKMNIKKLEKYINKDLIKEIKTKFPTEYLDRKKQKAVEKKEEKKENENKIRLAIGNSYKELKVARNSRTGGPKANKHKWKFFCRIEGENFPDKFIKKVVVHLHPTFSPNKLILTKPDSSGTYSFSRIGWGTFDIVVKVYWKSSLKLKPNIFEHELSFDGAGSYNHRLVDLKPKN